jgi:hypothetical protein
MGILALNQIFTRHVRLLCKQNQPEMAEPLLVRLEHEAESSGDLTMMPKRVIIATFFRLDA